MLLQNKLYVSKKVPPRERLKKLKKSCERSMKKIERVEKRSAKLEKMLEKLVKKS